MRDPQTSAVELPGKPTELNVVIKPAARSFDKQFRHENKQPPSGIAERGGKQCSKIAFETRTTTARVRLYTLRRLQICT